MGTNSCGRLPGRRPDASCFTSIDLICGMPAGQFTWRELQSLLEERKEGVVDCHGFLDERNESILHVIVDDRWIIAVSNLRPR